MYFYGGKLSTKKWQTVDRILVSGSGHDEFGYMIVYSSNDNPNCYDEEFILKK